MARRSRMSILKRQRELKKSEKAAQKRARRHGLPFEEPSEPTPTVLTEDLGAAVGEPEAAPVAERGEGTG